MSSLFTREWIALVILVATPMAGFAQRGGYDADAYPESNYGDGRPEAEPPRLFRGGLMHQLRSVTESVLGSEEEQQRPAAEPNRNIPKPPPLSSQNNRSPSSGRAKSPEGSRGGEQSDSSGAPNRNWAGQFLVPGARNGTPTPAARQPSPNQRSGEQRVYLGQRSSQRSGQRAAPERESSSGSASRSGSSDSAPFSREASTYQEDEASRSSDGLSLEASDSPSLSEEALEVGKAPAEVVVSHVPDVPYVPRKPLPKRDSKTSPIAGSDNQSAANVPTPKPSMSVNQQSEASLSLDASRDASQSPTVPSLEGASLPSLNAPLPTLAPVDSQSASAAELPSSVLPPLSTPEPGLPSSGSLMPSSPQLSPSIGSDSTGAASSSSTLSGGLTSDVPGSGLPTLNVPGASIGLESPALVAPESSPGVGAIAPQGPVSGTASAGSAVGGKRERMHMEIPHVAVKLLGPGDLATGTPTSYELVVQNPDRIALSGLILRMETPPGVDIVKNPAWGEAVELEKVEDGATLLMWSVGQVPAGGSTHIGLDLKATTSRNFAVAIEWTVLPQEGIDELTVKQADLQVALEGPVDVEKDVPNVYRVRVSNPGNAPARNVKVQVGAAAQQASQVDIGDLAAGQSEVVEMDLTFEKAGRLEIGANALADGSLKRNTNIVVNVRQPVLHASLSVPKSVLLGGNVFATMELRNTGDGPARKVQAGLMIPTDAEMVNPPSGVTRQGDKLLWEVEIVPAGQVVTVPIELRLPSAGVHALKFACVTPAGALTTAEASTTVESFADLKLLVNDPPTPAPIGAPVVYELSVTNRGTRDARNVTILAQFSEGIEPQSATGIKNRVVPGQVLFDAIPTIAAGETVKIKLTATASVAGMHRFRAEVRCEENDARLVEEESTRYLESASRIASPPSTLIQR